MRPHKVTTPEARVIPQSVRFARMPEHFVVRKTEKEIVDDFESTLLEIIRKLVSLCRDLRLRCDRLSKNLEPEGIPKIHRWYAT